MPTINTAGTGHGNKIEMYAGGLAVQYNVFPEGTPVEKERLEKLKRVKGILDRLAGSLDRQGPCNKYFRSLARGRSFGQIWNDNTIFLDLSPSNAPNFYGATHSNDKDVAISVWCLDTQNRWMVAATVVHELAHVGGAPGGASHAAEKAADECSFQPQYDPTILGELRQLGTALETLA